MSPDAGHSAGYRAEHEDGHPPRRGRHALAHPGLARRSQAERVEAMRARLLDATIECLAERGYRHTSTNDIVRRARVSRGALAHHFPTRAELVNAAARRSIDQRAAEFRARFRALGPERRTPSEALDVLWSFYDSPECLALLELTIAARHEPELRAVMADLPGEITELTTTICAEFFPELTAVPFLGQALRAVNAMFTGLALAAISGDQERSAIAEVRVFVRNLAGLAERFTATGDALSFNGGART